MVVIVNQKRRVSFLVLQKIRGRSTSVTHPDCIVVLAFGGLSRALILLLDLASLPSRHLLLDFVQVLPREILLGREVGPCLIETAQVGLIRS